MTKIIHCGWLFTAVDEQVRKRMAIEVVDGKLKRIAPIGEAITWQGEVVDFGDLFVMPGLIDAHVHITAGGGAADFGDIRKLTGTRVFDAVEHIQADLAAGFTTLRDEGSPDYVDVAVRDAVAAGRIRGPRLVVSGICLGATGGHADTHFAPQYDLRANWIVDGPDAARKAARTNLKHGADQIKLMATGGVISMGDEPGAQELTYEEMRAAIEVAQMQGKLSSAHAHGAAGIKAAVRAGVTSIEHGMLMDDECIELMDQHGTYLIPTLIAGRQIVEQGGALGLDPAIIDKAKRCLEHHAENLRKCRAAGLLIGFGTDAGTPGNPHGKQAREFALMCEAGFLPQEVLLAATRVNASLLGRQDLGTLEPGKRADLIALPESPLEDITAIERVAHVMWDGELI